MKKWLSQNSPNFIIWIVMTVMWWFFLIPIFLDIIETYTMYGRQSIPAYVLAGAGTLAWVFFTIKGIKND